MISNTFVLETILNFMMFNCDTTIGMLWLPEMFKKQLKSFWSSHKKQIAFPLEDKMSVDVEGI